MKGMFWLWFLMAVVLPAPVWLYGAKVKDGEFALIGAAVWTLGVTVSFLG